jgi:hypothetical protein
MLNNNNVPLAGDNEYGDPRGPAPVENGLTLYGGGDHSGPAQPDTSTAKDTLALGSRKGPGWEFESADMPR